MAFVGDSDRKKVRKNELRKKLFLLNLSPLS